MLKQIIKKINKDRLNNTLQSLSGKYVVAYWCNRKGCISNWGDALNPVLIELISGKKAIHINDLYNIPQLKVVSVIGSILDGLDLRSSQVWGSGFINSQSTFVRVPKQIFAVRGPLTRKKILALGVECPEIYGDPALLMPEFYRPTVEKKYEMGIIPHFMDREIQILEKFKSDSRVKIIDIRRGTYNVIDDVLTCKSIASSSLHGLILADAYKIPNTWFKLSDKLVGDDFKFYDYFQSVGRFNTKPLKANSDISLQQIQDTLAGIKNQINLERLLEVCPFNKKNNNWRA